MASGQTRSSWPGTTRALFRRSGQGQGCVRHSHVCEYVAGRRRRQPGEYPSGGPEPWVVDVWKAAGSALDFYAPDLYAENFAEWCKRYHRDGNPLFMPETRRRRGGSGECFLCAGRGGRIRLFSLRNRFGEMDDKGRLASSYATIAKAGASASRTPKRGRRAWISCSTRITTRWISPWAATRCM
jgi:hypothetical protein